jgi:hypothetical protein
MNFLSELLPIAGTAVSLVAVLWKFLDSVRTRSAEKKYAETLALDREHLNELLVLQSLNRLVKTERGEINAKRELSADEKAELEKLLGELRALTEKLSKEQGKLVLQGLTQPSAKGRVAYASKLLTEATADRPL